VVGLTGAFLGTTGGKMKVIVLYGGIALAWLAFSMTAFIHWSVPFIIIYGGAYLYSLKKEQT
jgi:hypothetical protein